MPYKEFYPARVIRTLVPTAGNSTWWCAFLGRRSLGRLGWSSISPFRRQIERQLLAHVLLHGFLRKEDDLMETQRLDQELKCDHCGKSFAIREELRRHESTCEK